IVDGQIAWMRYQIENPMREDSQTNDQRRGVTVVAKPALSGVEWVSAADSLVNERGHDAPKNGRDQTVRIRMKIRIDHAARGETLDDPQLLNSQQNQRRPDVIKKLDGDE